MEMQQSTFLVTEQRDLTGQGPGEPCGFCSGTVKNWPVSVLILVCLKLALQGRGFTNASAR